MPRFRAVSDHLVLLLDPGSRPLNRRFRAVFNHLFLLRTIALAKTLMSFRAVFNHLVLLLGLALDLPDDRFRAVSNYLVLLRCAGLRRLLVRFRTVLNHLDLLTPPKTSKSSPVSKPCQITWFSNLKTQSPPGFFCFTTVPDRRARLPPWRGGIATSREPTDSVRGLSDVLICYLLAHSTSLAPKADTGLYPGKVPP